MSETTTSFEQEIAAYQRAEKAPDNTVELQTRGSFLKIRERGCYITDLQLTSLTQGNRVQVLSAPKDLTPAKLEASHIMMPVGKFDGIGGQHGFPRWADFHAFHESRGKDGSALRALQAKRSDMGLGVTKSFELDAEGSKLTSTTTVFNYTNGPEHTSVGEHYYFKMEEAQVHGLTVNGRSLDDLLGQGAEAEIMNGQPHFWYRYDGDANIRFPEGYMVSLKTDVKGSLFKQVGMLIWRRPGPDSGTICFEPTFGYNMTDYNTGLFVPPHDKVEFTTSIEVL